MAHAGIYVERLSLETAGGCALAQVGGRGAAEARRVEFGQTPKASRRIGREPELETPFPADVDRKVEPPDVEIGAALLSQGPWRVLGCAALDLSPGGGALDDENPVHRSARRIHDRETGALYPLRGDIGQRVHDDDGEPPAGGEERAREIGSARPREKGFEHRRAGLGGQIGQHIVERPALSAVREETDAYAREKPRVAALPRGRVDPRHSVAKFVAAAVSLRESHGQAVPVAKHDLGAGKGLRDREPYDADAAARVENPARRGQDRIARHGFEKQPCPHIDIEG
jgi:hypothetical protein